MTEPASDTAVVIVAVCSMIPATIAAWASLRSARRATQARSEAQAANAAVNNQGNDQPSIYELAHAAAANARDAVRRVAELERLPAQIEQVAEIARKADRTATANQELLVELMRLHRRRDVEDDAARRGLVDRRRKRFFG